MTPDRSRRARRGRSLRLEPVEARWLLAFTPAANPGLLFADPTTNTWGESQFDGASFAEDSFLSSAVLGNWQRPLMGDFNGDGKQEFLALDRASGDWWLLGADDATPRRVGNWSPTTTYDHLNVVDLDGDGTDDVVGQNSSGSWWALQFAPNGPRNVFLGQWNNPANWDSLLFGDVDGDGADDIVGYNLTTGYWWKIGRNGQHFTNSIFAHWNTALSYSNTQLIDSNGDGVLNVIGFASDNACWTIEKHGDRYLNVLVGPWDRSIDWHYLGSGDLDGNGSTDLVARNPVSGAWVVIHWLNGSYRTDTINSWNPAYSYSATQIIDLNGDGRAEIVGLSNAGEWWATAFNGSWYPNQLLARWPGGELVEVQTGDFNGDGLPDIAGTQPDGLWRVLSFRGGRYATQTIVPSEHLSSAKAVVSGNIDGDGQEELVVWSSLDGLFRTIDLAAGTWQEQVLPGLLRAPIHTDSLYRVDFNGYGQQEPVTWDRETGRWFRLVFEGNTVSQQYLAQAGTDAAWQEPIVADLDGDGAAEILLRDAVSGYWWAIQQRAGRFRFVPIAHWNSAQTFTDLQATDLDGDGRQEVVGRADNGEWWAIANRQGSIRNLALGKWSSDEWTTLAADLDGDGVQELVGFNGRSNQWRQIRYDGAAFVDEALATWPANEAYEHLLTVDLDGDGADELIGRGSTTGIWRRFGLRASDPSEAIATWRGGTLLQSALVGDFDGDGADEVAMQLRATGVWGLLDLASDSYSIQEIAVTGLADNVTAADLTLDGRNEIVWQDRFTGEWFAYDPSREITQSILTGQALLGIPSLLLPDLPGNFDAQLKFQISQDLPELESLLAADRLEAAMLLLDWCANEADYDRSGNLNQRTTNALISGPVAAVYFEQFAADRGAVWCGGYAVFFSSVLKLFGIDNFTVNFGDLHDGLTHVTVVVPVRHDGQWRHYILDPTFNLTFVETGTSRRMSWFELLDAVAAGRPDQIDWQSQSVARRDWLSYDPSAPAGSEYSSIQIPDYGLPTYLADSAANLVRNGYRSGIEGFVQLLNARVFSVGSSLVAESRADFVAALLQRGVPMGPG